MRICATIGAGLAAEAGLDMDEFMAMAIEEASATKAEGGSPFGAVLVRGGEVIGRGRNLMIQNNDPLSHGEMEAIKAAGLQESYADTVLYTTAFPLLDVRRRHRALPDPQGDHRRQLGAQHGFARIHAAARH